MVWVVGFFVWFCWVDNIVLTLVEQCLRKIRVCLSCCPDGAKQVGKGHSWNSWSKLKATFFSIWCWIQQEKLGERSIKSEQGRERHLELQHLTSQVTVTHNETLLSWKQLDLSVKGKQWLHSLFCFIYLVVLIST